MSRDLRTVIAPRSAMFLPNLRSSIGYGGIGIPGLVPATNCGPHAEERNHLIACGLIGDPVPPVMTSGGPQKKNS
jgi:hypothetical protein